LPTFSAGLADISPQPVGVSVPLDAIVCTQQLWLRPRRLPDYETESRAFSRLAAALASSPTTILQALADAILDVFKADSAGVSLLTPDEKNFHWPAIAGCWKPHLGGGTPRNFGPCGDVLDQNAPILFSHWEKRYPYLLETMPLAEEGLLVPFYKHAKPIGTIWAISHGQRKFDAEDLRQLETIARFASAAYQVLQISADLDEQKRTEQHHRLLIDELNHRVKNTLALVQSFAIHTFRASPERDKFEGRIMAVARSHDLLSQATWKSISLRDLLRIKLDPYKNGSTYELEGPAVELRPKTALALGLAFHELSTNAAKYGALSGHAGLIRVSWSVRGENEQRQLSVCWKEEGGPEVKPVRKRGFGLRLIERSLSLELNGQVRFRFEPPGLLCELEIPLG
jgi:two-component sensor histidine kinase